MKIKITGCSSENLWYKNQIGEVFKTHTAQPYEVSHLGLVYSVIERPYHYVKVEDCKEIRS